MKTILKTALLFLVNIGLWSCYDDYTGDYVRSSAQFILQQPLRTVVPDRGQYTDIYVGVSIGGKREVNSYDWATFEIDPSLLGKDPYAGKLLCVGRSDDYARPSGGPRRGRR